MHPFQVEPVFWADARGSEWAVTVTWAPISDNDTGQRHLAPLVVQVGSLLEEEQEGRAVVRTLKGGPRPVTRELVKRLPLAQMLEESRLKLLTELDQQRDQAASLVTDGYELPAEYVDMLKSVEILRHVHDEPPGRRRRASDDDERLLRQVAALYDEALRGGGKPAREPAKYVHERLKEAGSVDRYTSRESVRKLVRRARQRGYLAPTQERRPGGGIRRETS